jgi:hypothetical protein
MMTISLNLSSGTLWMRFTCLSTSANCFSGSATRTLACQRAHTQARCKQKNKMLRNTFAAHQYVDADDLPCSQKTQVSSTQTTQRAPAASDPETAHAINKEYLQKFCAQSLESICKEYGVPAEHPTVLAIRECFAREMPFTEACPFSLCS